MLVYRVDGEVALNAIVILDNSNKNVISLELERKTSFIFHGRGEVRQPHFWEQEETVAFSWKEGRSSCNSYERDGKGSCIFQSGGKRCLAGLWVRVGLGL